MAVGCCNHKEVCARCALRMRLNYQDTACPLCKAELEEVLPTAPPGSTGGKPCTDVLFFM